MPWHALGGIKRSFQCHPVWPRAPKLDPGFVALLNIVVTFRTQCSPDIAFPVLSAIVNIVHLVTLTQALVEFL